MTLASSCHQQQTTTPFEFPVKFEDAYNNLNEALKISFFGDVNWTNNTIDLCNCVHPLFYLSCECANDRKSFYEKIKNIGQAFVQEQIFASAILESYLNISSSPEVLSEKNPNIMAEEALTLDVQNELEKDNLLREAFIALRIAKDTYNSLKKQELSISYDPEIEDYKTYCLKLFVSDEPEKILCEEDKFQDKFYKLVGSEAATRFTITYSWK